MALNQKKFNSEENSVDERQLRLQHRFLVLRKLGQGTYGKVQLALNKETNEEVAVKTIKKAKIENEEDMLRIRREIHIMTSIRHPHIIHINEVFETRQKIVIVMQYASGGELYDYLGCHQTLPEEEARRIFRQIASAIYYCHKNRICHRDLKLENILLDEEGNAQIADFGLSNIFDDKRRMNTFCGSPLYASPEIVKGTPYKGPEVDCWSLGVLLYTLVYGTMPFDGRSFKELVSQISEGKYNEPINRSNASSLIRWLLTPDISRRATIIDVCKDSWINYGYDASLLQVAENMSLTAGFSRQENNATKLYLETNTKNGREKSIFKKATEQIEEKAGNCTSILTKNFENITKTNDTSLQTHKSNLYEQITNYDVRFVLNKLIATVEASLSSDKNTRNLTTTKTHVRSMQKKEDSVTKKVDSAYVIPIFEVTSTIPSTREKIFNDHQERGEMQNKIIINGISPNGGIPHSEKESSSQSRFQIQTSENVSAKIQPTLEIGKHSSQAFDIRTENHSSMNSCSRNQILLTESQKQYYSLDISGQDTCKTDFENRKQREHEHPELRHPPQKTKRDGFPFAPKLPSPFMRTKHHVLSLARLLSLNYEKIKRNSFRMPTCKKKPPGKITIPPTFDPNNPPAAIKKLQEEKKELLLFPTVSVSENKEKIEKKIDKIKKAALNKNMIIRSDSKTRLRIEKYIMSQVKRIQDLVCEEQRSIHASLENLDEQSLRDMSEMYYRAFGSENTDSGIANAEDEEYFCFLCSKPSSVKGTSGVIDSEVLESIKKGCLYASNHLHIPRGKEHNRWNFVSNNNNPEFGTLSRCKSEIEFPTEYLNYISTANSDLSKRTQQRQHLQKNNIGNTKCFFAMSPTLKPVNSNLRILRSASDSVGLHLNNNTFEVVKLSTDSHDDVLPNFQVIPHFLEQMSTSNRCDISQMTDHYDTQSFAVDTEQTMSMNTSRMSEKDDGIGDSNDSFQSYMETFDNNVENKSEISRSKSSHSYINFVENSSKNKNALTKRLSSEPHLMHNYGIDNFETQFSEGRVNKIDSLDTGIWASIQNGENKLDQLNGKSKGLRRRNTMTCVLDETERQEDLKLDQTSTEFENYLWNAYKEHLLESTQSDTEFSSSPNLNYYSLDRKSRFKATDCRSVDYIKGEPSRDYLSANFSQNSDQESNEPRSSNVRNILKHSNISKNQKERSSRSLSRTKSIAGEMLSDSDREEMIRKLRAERKQSHGNISYDTNSNRMPFFSNFLNDLEQRDQERRADRETNRRRMSKSTLPHNKKTKSEYKKSFLQLLALKRIQEAEKEMDKVHRNDLPEVAEENSGSLLEALKTHGYKSVISQRFKDTDDDYLDPFQAYLKSPRNLRAELARLNYMYYESLPRYNEENDYTYDDFDYTTSLGNGYAIPSAYDVHNEFKQKTSKQSVHDWLNTTQTDEYLNSFRSDSLYTPEETSTSDSRKYCPQRAKENSRSFDDESTSESQDTIEEHVPNSTFSSFPKEKESARLKNTTNHSRTENPPTSDDKKQESVQDRIWRKSFYSRFNNRALSRKERSSSFLEPEFLSESRLGLLNNLYNPPRTGVERSEFSPWDGSNKSLHSKKLRKHSSSFDKYESSSNIKKRYVRLSKERETVLESNPSNSNEVHDTFTAPEEIEPEH